MLVQLCNDRFGQQDQDPRAQPSVDFDTLRIQPIDEIDDFPIAERSAAPSAVPAE